MRKEEFKKIVNALTIESIEMEGGHVIAKHDKLTDSDLIDRCARCKKDLATTFECSRVQILKMIQETLLDDEFETPECILEWLDDDSDGGLFIAEKDYEESVGRGFFRAAWHNWEKGAVTCHRVSVILKKVERKNDYTFKIITAYPTVTEEDIKKDHK